MKGLLLDTNVVSELRKGARANANVRTWFSLVDDAALFLSVLVIGEMHRGVEAVRKRDPAAARALDRWLARVERQYESRLLAVDRAVATEWGRLDATYGLPAIDGLLVATARVHELALVTRNTRDVRRTGIAFIDPFQPPEVS